MKPEEFWGGGSMPNQMPDPPTTQEVIEMLRPLGITVGAAASGIIWRWSEEYRSGERFTWRRVLFDLASSVGIGLSAWATADWLNLPDTASVAIACGVGTLGRNGAIELVLRWRGHLDNNRKRKGDEK